MVRTCEALESLREVMTPVVGDAKLGKCEFEDRADKTEVAELSEGVPTATRFAGTKIHFKSLLQICQNSNFQKIKKIDLTTLQ